MIAHEKGFNFMRNPKLAHILVIIYNLLTNPPQHPKDEESRIDEDVLSYESSLEEIMDYYNASQTINADQDPHTVFESLENLLVKPLPKQSIKVGI